MNIVFFGDSICFGEKVSPHKTWITRLSAAIDRKYGDRFLIINSSINGNTTRMALERMPSDVQRYGVDVLFIQFGMNDCNYWQTDRGIPRVSPEAFKCNLNEIIDRGQNFGAKKIFLQTNHPTLRNQPFEHIDRSYESGNAHYNSLIREVSHLRNDIILLDMERQWQYALAKGTKLETLLLEDALHLSAKGHDLYYTTARPPLFQVLELLAAHP